MSAVLEEGRALKSLISGDGRLALYTEPCAAPAPGPGEIVVRVQAAPINPSDLGLMFGPADLADLEIFSEGERRGVRARVPEERLASVAARLGAPLPVGNEGAGVVVAAGAGAEALVGRTVAAYGGGMYARLRTLRADDVMVFDEGVAARDAASSFINPLTALGMVETLRLEGHLALVHTAAASNLGRMLIRICAADAVPLVNIVRSEAQARLLREEGAEFVVASEEPEFTARLGEAVAATGATLAFDAVGGGRLCDQILSAMEAALAKSLPSFSRYGSSVHKQVYLYGGLDLARTELSRSYGMSWGVGGWLLPLFLQRAGAAAAERLKDRVRRELLTTFSSRYAAQITLEEAVDPEVLRAYARRATGEKRLITP